jgi:aerobic carbon-monoxide dehydrogenase medium subunit
VKPPRFAYHCPDTLADALLVLGRHADDSKVLAGGQSLMPMLNFRLAAPGHLVDINRLPGLGEIERTPGGWRIPALVRQRTAERSAALAAGVPLLAEALAQVAHPQIRNRGTICGSLAHGDAAAELPSVMLALDARMSVAGAGGVRVVPAAEFFLFHLTTAVEPDEILVAVEFDDPAPRTYSAFREFSPRTGDFCLAGTGVTVTFGEDGSVEDSRVVLAGVAATPRRVRAAEDAIAGSRLEGDALAAAQAAAYHEIEPSGDAHADIAFRRQLASVLVRRALADVGSRVVTGEESHGIQ